MIESADGATLANICSNPVIRPGGLSVKRRRVVNAARMAAAPAANTIRVNRITPGVNCRALQLHRCSSSCEIEDAPWNIGNVRERVRSPCSLHHRT